VSFHSHRVALPAKTDFQCFRFYRVIAKQVGVLDGIVRPQQRTQIERLETMKKQLSRISILQSSKITTALYVLMGFIYTAIGIPMFIFGNEKLKILAIIYILMPIIMAIFGFIFFVIFAAIYNLLAKWFGGIEVEVKDITNGA
jgi:hypothetical protein